MVYVLDCSVALKWFLPEPLSDEAHNLLTRFRAKTDHLLAPDLLIAEFGYVLRKRSSNQELPPHEVQEIFGDFLDLGIETVAIPEVARDAMRLALLHMGNFYDALYVALAQMRGCSVVTADDRMNNAFGPIGCVISLQTLGI
jgi:predicted nucleic acid-binding protein